MPGARLFVLALLLAPPLAEPPEPDTICDLWVFDGDIPPWPEPTENCPRWRINVAFPEELDVDLAPAIWRRHRCVLYLIRPRESFFEVMTHQAAGMLATPVARTRSNH